ncbi:major tail protein [Shewanella sp. phage 1/44]|uniref:major tail protein with Ig-like domain n=1 Tax=Shewanella sp. phage 1/44 TaxID=1458862 RepID=UPI0004F8816E|nr:major tail protein with Ig-like domain [Shewanella sp. phage 1/44]AHK11750.1 major tail protein [Shewanella sp. phage 1/44]
MSSLTRNRSFIGGGKIWIREKAVDSTTPQMYAFGNADSFSFAINEDKKTQRNFTTPGGGNIASQSSITDVTASVNALSFQPRTLALALRSLIKTIASAAIVGETHKVYKDALEPLLFIPKGTETITVTSQDGVTTFVNNVDYVIEHGGIYIPEASTITVADTTNVGVSIKIDYTSQDTFSIEAITQSSIEYEIFFNGFNDADNGKPTTVKCHKVKFSPATALELISEDFGSLPMTFEVLADDSITAADISKYFKIDMVA